jgi:hypothetical protein
MKWWMSYMVVSSDGSAKIGHNVYAGDEHPILKIRRWHLTYGKADGASYFLLNFQQVGDDMPEIDTEAYLT